MTRPKQPDISVILTGYNEEPDVAKNLIRIRDLLNISKYKWEMILYDDKSSDSTPLVFEEFAKKHKNVFAYFHKKNIGRGGTVVDAIRKSKGKYVGYIDTDLELSPVYLFEFVRNLESGADIVIAQRFYTVSAQNFLRTIMSKGYIFCMHMILGLPYKDTESGFKFFKRGKILPILKKIKDKRWFFDTEIIARSHLAGLKIVEVPLVYIRNPQKASSVRLIEDTLAYANKLLQFRKEVNKKYAHRHSHS